MFPLRPQDSFRNDFGFFNFTLPVLFNLPPLDVVSRIVAYPFELVFGNTDPAYYPKDGVPFRFVGLSSGVSVQIFDKDFNALALNPQQYDEFIFQIVNHLVQNGADSTTTIISGDENKENAVGPFVQITFFIGEHFATQNTVRNMRPSFGVDIDFNNIPSYSYSAEINCWEYAGSIRYSLTASRLQPYLKGGYGWSWYRLENVQANGEPFEPADSDWIGPSNIWPNVWHLGIGLEVLPKRRVGRFLGGMEISLAVEYARYFQNLNLDLSSIPLEKLGIVFPTLGDVPGSNWVTRDDFLLGLTLSY